MIDWVLKMIILATWK